MFYPYLEGDALQAFNQAKDKVRAKAIRSGLASDDIITRDLMPIDVGMTSTYDWQFPLTTTSGWNTLFTEAAVADNRWLILAGLHDATSTPLPSQLRVTKSGELKRLWNIQALGQQKDNSFWFDDPITVDANTKIKVEAYNNTTTSAPAYELILLGATVEKKGLVINPD